MVLVAGALAAVGVVIHTQSVFTGQVHDGLRADYGLTVLDRGALPARARQVSSAVPVRLADGSSSTCEVRVGARSRELTVRCMLPVPKLPGRAGAGAGAVG